MFGIGQAVKELRDGKAVGRAGWNGKNMFLFLVPNTLSEMHEYELGDDIELRAVELPWVAMRTVDGTVVPWLCSQTDLLATDWELVEV